MTIAILLDDLKSMKQSFQLKKKVKFGKKTALPEHNAQVTQSEETSSSLMLLKKLCVLNITQFWKTMPVMSYTE